MNTNQMQKDLAFLKVFPKDAKGMYIIYELFSFDNLFRLLLRDGFDNEEALNFIKICQNTPQLCWGDEWPPSPLGGEG